MVVRCDRNIKIVVHLQIPEGSRGRESSGAMSGWWKEERTEKRGRLGGGWEEKGFDGRFQRHQNDRYSSSVQGDFNRLIP